MNKLLLVCACLFGLSVFAASEEEETTQVKAGQPAPAFHVTLHDGKVFDLQVAKGKVVLVNFFATWCGPCMAEMPQLQDKIWSRFKDQNFMLVAIDREETEPVVKAFQKKRAYGFPIACDPKRDTYAKFATKFIPRNFLIDTNGVVVYQSVGYNEAEFQKLIAAIERETAKAH